VNDPIGRWATRLRTYFRSWFGRGRLEREMEEELRFHLEQQIDENLAAGIEPEEARRRARLRFGRLDTVKEECRDQRRVAWLDAVFQDLRFGGRALARSPGLLAVSVLSLGLGTGLNFALYTMTSAIFLRQPTMTEPERVFGVELGDGRQLSYLNLRDLDEGGIPARLVGFRSTALSLRAGDQVGRVGALAVTADFFEVLGIETAIGRTFGADEAAPERDPRLVVITHGFWQSRFAGDPGAIGAPITLDGRPYVISGVLPEDYRAVTGFSGPSFYVPLSRAISADIDERGTPLLTVLARLHRGASPEQLGQALTTLGAALEEAFPERNAGLGAPARVYPVRAVAVRGTPAGFRVLPVMMLVLFGLLLLLACANVAGLLLARSVERRLELTVRVALGASRLRLLQLLLIESFLLSVLGALAGVLVAFAASRWMVRGPLSPLGTLMTPDSSVLLYALGLIAVTTLVCGISPAMRALHADLLDRLKTDGGGSTGRSLTRSAFVTAQVAASVTLLVMSSLCLRSQLRLSTIDLGFDVDRGVVARLQLDREDLPSAERVALADALVSRLEGVPGVHSVAIADVVPLGGDSLVHSFHPAGRTDIPGTRPSLYSVGPRYFETLGIRLVAGREFSELDALRSEPVVIVNETYAKTYFPVNPELEGRELGGRALGQRVQTGDEAEATVVGVAADVRIGTLGEAPKSVVYYPFAQRPGRLVAHIAAHGDHETPDPEVLVRPVEQAIGELDGVLDADVGTLRSATSLELSMRRSATGILGAVGGIGLMLAMVGLFGVVANSVAARRTEIGLRMALGASAARLRLAVLTQCMRLVVAGILLGWALSLPMTPKLATFLAGTSPFDPVAFGGTALVLIVVGLLAGYLPAHRASRVDPTVALRQD